MSFVTVEIFVGCLDEEGLVVGWCVEDVYVGVVWEVGEQLVSGADLRRILVGRCSEGKSLWERKLSRTLLFFRWKTWFKIVKYSFGIASQSVEASCLRMYASNSTRKGTKI